MVKDKHPFEMNTKERELFLKEEREKLAKRRVDYEEKRTISYDLYARNKLIPKKEDKMTKDKNQKSQKQTTELNIKAIQEKIESDIKQLEEKFAQRHLDCSSLIIRLTNNLSEYVTKNNEVISDKAKQVMHANMFLVAVCSITIILYAIKLLA